MFGGLEPLPPRRFTSLRGDFVFVVYEDAVGNVSYTPRANTAFAEQASPANV